MMLFIDGIRKGIQYENVNYWIQDYDSAFEFLTQLTADQWTLEHVIIVDNGDCISMPVEAFDGQPIQVHVHALEQEWNQILAANPTNPKDHAELRLKNCLLRFNTYYDKLLSHLGKMIVQLEIQKCKVDIIRDEEIRLLLSHKYGEVLESNRRMYQQTIESRHKNQQRLEELEKYNTYPQRDWLKE